MKRKANKTINVAVLSVITIMAGFGVLIAGSQSVNAAPATFTVTNTNDSGAGSLRQAIIDANSNSNPADIDVINFSVAGTIGLVTELPVISQPVTINGYSAPGSAANTATAPQPLNGTLVVVLDGALLATD